MVDIFTLICASISVILAAYTRNIHAVLGWLCVVTYAIQHVFLL